ncbi:hypothetical protein TRVA0_053S00936 [Trichomonascus vanleenenianus]|uniref:Vps54p n=1 Tax=Trichomonascus vanleenenianus TaxID=2268995 RepID=UPI003ECB451F
MGAPEDKRGIPLRALPPKPNSREDCRPNSRFGKMSREPEVNSSSASVNNRLSIDSSVSTPHRGRSTVGLGLDVSTTPNQSSIVGHRRSSSVTSGVSSLNLPSQYASSVFSPSSATQSFYLPPGYNRQSALGANAISDIVDGYSSAPEESGGSLLSPSSAANARRQSTNNAPPAAVRQGKHSPHPFRPPTSKDIPPVTLTPIPKVKKTEFSQYLDSIADLYDDFYATRMTLGDEENGSSSSLDLQTRSNISSLSTIPDVFFNEDFQMDNPRIFDVVSENSVIVRGDGDEEENDGTRRILATNSILQEKLSWYIDTVELHLINEISKASASFFSALGDLKDIRYQTAQCIAKIESLRRDLAVADEKRAVAGIDLLKLRRRRRNASILAQSLQQIATVLSKADEAELFLAQENQIKECLDTIDAAEALLAGQAEGSPLVKEWTSEWLHPLVDLRQVYALNDLRESLANLRTRAGQSYSTAFAEMLLEDIRKHYESVPNDETLYRMGRLVTASTRRGMKTQSANNTRQINTDYNEISPQLRTELADLFKGLMRSENVTIAMKTYKDKVIREARNIVRMYLPTNSDSASMSSMASTRTAADKSNHLRSALIDMSAEDAEEMVIDVYTTSSEMFRRLATQQKLLLDVTSSIIQEYEKTEGSGGSVSFPPMDLTELLAAIVKLSQDRMSKILKVRQGNVAKLGLQPFLNYFMLNSMFLSECEAVSGDTSDDLRNTLTYQIKTFLNTFHRQRLNGLTTLMEKDNWKEALVDRVTQELADRLVKCAERVPDEWISSLQQVIEKQESKVNNENEDSTLRSIVVGEESFIVAKAGLETIGICESYLKISVALPHLGNEVVTNLNELLMKFHNNVADLILGAGAVRVGGLKHITAKHLALSYQSLNLVVTLVPYMRECARRLPSVLTSRLQELDNTKREMQQQQDKIRDKFVSIMDDRISAHSRAVERVDWSKDAEEPCNKYMVSLVKDVSVLVKIVNNILPHGVYLEITKQIFELYKRKILDQYIKVEFKSVTEKKRMIKDAEYFASKLDHIEGSGNAAEVVLENVNVLHAPGENDEEPKPQEPEVEPEQNQTKPKESELETKSEIREPETKSEISDPGAKSKESEPETKLEEKEQKKIISEESNTETKPEEKESEDHKDAKEEKEAEEIGGKEKESESPGQGNGNERIENTPPFEEPKEESDSNRPASRGSLDINSTAETTSTIDESPTGDEVANPDSTESSSPPTNEQPESTDSEAAAT